MGADRGDGRIEVPVLVVGAGPTGLVAANLLGQAGIATVLVERNEGTVNEARAVSIDDEGLRTIQAIGLIGEVARDIGPGYGYRYFSASGRCFARVLPSTREYGYPRRSPFRQPLLEATLCRGLARFANVRVLFGHTLEGFEQERDGVTARLRAPGGGTLEARADYLLACDGGASTVRRSLGIAMAGSSFEERWLILDMIGAADEDRHTRVHCDPARPAITLPGPAGTRRWEFLLRPDESDGEMLRPEAGVALLRHFGGDEAAEIVRRVVYTFHARMAERWRAGRVFLLGDAAHLAPPFAGQGMNTGLRDAHNLAWKLAAVIEGRIGEGVLDTYEAERRDHAWRMINLSLRMGRILNPRTRLRSALLVNGVRLANVVPGFRDYLLEMRFKPKPRFAKGFVIADTDGRRRTLVGRMFPQPTVVTAGGDEVLLDEATGNGFAALAYGAKPGAALAALTQPVWQRLGVRRVGVLPPDAPDAPAPGPGIEIVRDADGALAPVLGRRDGRIVLVRPDRYVAGAFAADDAPAFAASLENLIDRGTAGR
jgi:3-(3-hydroxy-phenyl)propionate hydroxylase